LGLAVQLGDTAPVDRVVERAPHASVVEGRTLRVQEQEGRRPFRRLVHLARVTRLEPGDPVGWDEGEDVRLSLRDRRERPLLMGSDPEEDLVGEPVRLRRLGPDAEVRVSDELELPARDVALDRVRAGSGDRLRTDVPPRDPRRDRVEGRQVEEEERRRPAESKGDAVASREHALREVATPTFRA
jgi:hypothetical protein